MTAALDAVPDARTLFDRAARPRILVVGDLMIDEWIWGAVTRISPEAPVPVVAVTITLSRSAAPGTSRTICARSAPTSSFAGTVGDDSFAEDVRELLRGEQVDDSGVFTVSDRPTTRKTRVVAHNQQVVRADWESTAAPSARERRASPNSCARTRRSAMPSS